MRLAVTSKRVLTGVAVAGVLGAAVGTRYIEAPPARNGDRVATVQLVLKHGSGPYRSNDAIPVDVITTNVTGETISWATMGTEFDNKIFIHNAWFRSPPLTAYGQKVQRTAIDGSRGIPGLNPGESVTDEFNLRDIFDLSSGGRFTFCDVEDFEEPNYRGDKLDYFSHPVSPPVNIEVAGGK